jgi:hypothetical protein
VSRAWGVTFGVMCALDLLLVIALTLRGRRILAERKQPALYREVVVDALTRDVGATRHGSYFGLPVLTAEEEQEMEDARRQGVPALRFAFRLRALDNMRWTRSAN